MFYSWNNICIPCCVWQFRYIKHSFVCTYYLPLHHSPLSQLLGSQLPFFVCSSGAPTFRKWLSAPESYIVHSQMFEKLVSIVASSVFGGGCQDGAIPKFSKSLLAANLHMVLWDWFWCLPENLWSAWPPHVRCVRSRFWKPGGGVVLLFLGAGIGHEW